MLVVCCGMLRSGSTLQYNLICALVKSCNAGTGHGFIEPNVADEYATRLAMWAHDTQLHVVKSHELLPFFSDAAKSGQARICYTYRDLRDVAGSAKRQFNVHNEKLLQAINAAIKTFSEVKQLPNVLVQRYESMIVNLPGTTQELAKHLALVVDVERIRQIARDWSPENILTPAVTQSQSVFLRDTLPRLFCQTGITAIVRRLGLLPMLKRLSTYLPDWCRIGRTSDDNSLLHQGHISSVLAGSQPARNILSLSEKQTIERQFADWLSANGYTP